MKKAIMLTAAAIAMISAPLFAEITVSGEFEAQMSYEFNDTLYSEEYLDASTPLVGTQDGDNDIQFNIETKIGEFTSIDVDIDAEAGQDVFFNEMSLTQDFTGALGLDTPVTLSYTIGNSDGEAYQYYDELDPVALIGGNELDLNFTIGLMDMVNVQLNLVPSSYTEDAAGADRGNEFGVAAYGVFGPASVAVSYMYTDKAIAGTDIDDDLLRNTGVEFNTVLDFSPVTVSAQLQMFNLNDDTNALGTHIRSYVYAAYAMDMGLTLGANFNNVSASDNETEEYIGFGADISYAVNDMWNVDAYVDVTDSEEIVDSLEYGVGTDYTLDGATYGLDFEIANAATSAAETYTVTFTVGSTF